MKCQSYMLSFLFFIVSIATCYGQSEKVLIYGNTFTKSVALKTSFLKLGFQTQNITTQQLLDLDIKTSRLLLLSGDGLLPPESRVSISRFLSSGGHVIVVGINGFNYSPEAKNPVSLVQFENAENYKIIKPIRKKKFGSQEKPVIKAINGAGQSNGIEFKTVSKGMSDIMVQFPVKAHRSPSRSVLTFNAKGNHYMDLLALEIKDEGGRKWSNFVPISREWKNYVITLADFIPDGWSDTTGSYPLLQPESIDSLAIGTNLLTVWSEKAMEFSVSDVCIAENKKGIYVPTSALMSLRIPYKENNMSVPEWLIDPFYQAKYLTSKSPVFCKDEYPFGKMSVEGLKQISLLPNIFMDFPGSMMSTDTRRDYDKREERESRIYPILQVLDENRIKRDVARLIVYGGGMYKGSSMAVFGVDPAELLSHDQMVSSVAKLSKYMVQTAKVIAVKINTATSKVDKTIVPQLKISVSNPGLQTVTGKLLVEVGHGILSSGIAVKLIGRSSESYSIDLPVVPENFPFKKFDWKVVLESNQGRDEFRDSVDVERSMLFAFKHLVETQNSYPDGRYSNHYFGDAYGVRAMFSYLNYLSNHPQSLKTNTDIWKTLSPAEIEKSATRFCDMLVKRQNSEGAIPMGYSENTRGYNVADGGQIALSLAQLSRYVGDSQKKKSYLDFCYKFADWAETFYIDSTLSNHLLADPKVKKKDAVSGLYGLGMSGNSRRQAGPSWVLSDILAVQQFLGYVDKNERYKRIADRNADFYVKSMYNAAGYYQSEALFWVWMTSKSAELKGKIKENLQKTFLPPLYHGEIDDMYKLGSRNTLRTLPLLYYQKHIEDNASIRAVLLKNVWSFGSGSSVNSMQRIADIFGKPVHGESLSASKYASLSSLWAMELLDPGSTLFNKKN